MATVTTKGVGYGCPGVTRRTALYMSVGGVFLGPRGQAAEFAQELGRWLERRLSCPVAGGNADGGRPRLAGYPEHGLEPSGAAPWGL